MRCKSCNAEIIWITMESGKKMPIDKDSVVKRIVINDGETKGAIRKTGTSHFETCPYANTHRKERK